MTDYDTSPYFDYDPPPAPRPTKDELVNRELQACREIASLLIPLTPDQRSRTIRWLGEVFDDSRFPGAKL